MYMLPDARTIFTAILYFENLLSVASFVQLELKNENQNVKFSWGGKKEHTFQFNVSTRGYLILVELHLK